MKAAERLRQFGITTIGTFAALPTATVVQILGARGRTLHAAALGQDTAPQIPPDTGVESTWQYAPTACADATILVRHVQRESVSNPRISCRIALFEVPLEGAPYGYGTYRRC